MPKKRTAYRVRIPEDANIFLAFGMETYKTRYRVLDLSETGVLFFSSHLIRDFNEGDKKRVYLHFPWLKDSLAAYIKVVRIIKKEAPKEAPKPEQDDAVETEPEMRTVYHIATNFEGLTIGMQDKIFHQVRVMERKNIVSSREEEEMEELEEKMEEEETSAT